MKHLHTYHSEQGIGPLFEKILSDGGRTGSPSTANEVSRNSPSSQTGQQLKEKGIKEVSEHNENWMERCLNHASIDVAFKHKKDFTGEDIRMYCLEWVEPPRHPNAWGALISILLKRGIIVPTGEYRKMKDRTSHARKTPVYKAK